MNTHNKESVQQRLQMSYGHTEPYIVSPFETKCFNTGNKKYRAGKIFMTD